MGIGTPHAPLLIIRPSVRRVAPSAAHRGPLPPECSTRTRTMASHHGPTLTSSCRCVNYDDPFGLCPPQDKNYSTCVHGSPQWKEGANRSQSAVAHTSVNPVSFLGVTASEVIGVGPTVSAGVYADRYGIGAFFTVGLGTGLDIGAGLHGGYSTSATALGGDAEGGCAGVTPVAGCLTSNSAGKTVSAGPTGSVFLAGGAMVSTTTFTTSTSTTRVPCEYHPGRPVCKP